MSNNIEIMKNDNPSKINNDAKIVISDSEYAELSEATNAEQAVKLRCWDIQEYINNVNAQKDQLDEALSNANEQLEEAKSTLVSTRSQLRTTFDKIFGPFGLDNKMVSVSQTSPHEVTIVENQPAPQSDV